MYKQATDMLNIISLENVSFFAIMIIYARFRKNKIFSLDMVRGMTIYIPPQ